MAIPEGKKRTVLTFPEDALRAFKADAKALNMSLSSYAYLVLAANSLNMEEGEASEMCNRLSALMRAKFSE